MQNVVRIQDFPKPEPEKKFSPRLVGVPVCPKCNQQFNKVQSCGFPICPKAVDQEQ